MKCVKLKIYPKGYGREIYRVIAVDPKKLTQVSHLNFRDKP